MSDLSTVSVVVTRMKTFLLALLGSSSLFISQTVRSQDRYLFRHLEPVDKEFNVPNDDDGEEDEDLSGNFPNASQVSH